MDITVVGAGPTGLVLACGLLGAGLQVRVVDGADGPAVTSRALGLQPRGAEVLDRLGALGDLPERSIGIDRIALHVNGKPLGALKVGQVTKLVKRRGLMISQTEVEGQLRERLAELGGAVEWGTSLVDAHQDARGVRLTTADGRESRTDWLVGCDGAHSVVRKASGIGFPGAPLVERFLLADVVADLPLERDVVAVWLSGEDMLAAFPLPGGVWRLMAPAPAGFRDDGDIAAVMAGLLRDRAALPDVVVASTAWTSSFRFHRRLADTYCRGRVLLAGDAAHIHSPFGGQGMNTGLGDAENLAWKLALVASGHAEAALLDTYEAERRPIAEGVLSSTSGMTRLIVGESATARFLRDHVLVPMMNRGFVQKAIWEKSSQLKVTYRGGPLGGGHRFGRGPRPGDRVPDRQCARADGTGTRLHAELGSRWVLLGGADHALVARKRLGEERVTVLPTDGETELIRPDGHLAWRGHGGPDALDSWLTGILGT
ncbi:FAD-dependent monooxygenase [Umezawaea endophytica]|uniref:FAD-dependent monooxygenase n=1 Tax=Umezawaea endophytica TaxID=1654476 RepID=A0A9X2VT12_9PSEU|nr:FAD-dependent monooxygenase [Umezawaea endophytica]MCS7481043.1 FAD-dependent monooxygenase [Umezawaea endophytica]